jgi:hypothetical protein
VARKSQGNTEMTDRELIYCTGCDHDKKPSEFYKSYGTTKSGTLPYCKQCCINMSLNNIGNLDIDNFKNMLSKVDRPFLYQTLADNLKKYPNKIESAIGFYFKDLGMVQNRNLKFKDSLFTPESNIDSNDLMLGQQPLLSNDDRRRLIDKWGFGYNDEELYSFERKYDLLKENYPQKTAMHTEALLTYIRYRVKEELATAKGDVSEAQKWGQLADKASERAKINPSQLSKADLSGGLNGFGELSRAVEQAVDIVSILPRFTEKPQDKVDFTLWCYINYIRRLKNLPDVEYKDIWNFYEERREEYKKEGNREFEFEDE